MDNLSLDAIGQHPYLHKLYTQICCIFPAPRQSSQNAIIKILDLGLERIAESFPWIAGKVVYDKIDCAYKIVPTGRIPLVINDLQRDVSAPTMKDMRNASFPCSMLDERTFAPCLTVNPPARTNPNDPESDFAPVFAVQANFISGGLVLTFVAQHNVTDMAGQDCIMSLLSKACHSQQFTQEELEIGRMDRTIFIPMLGDDYDIWNPGPELEHHVNRPAHRMEDKASLSDTNPPTATWGCVVFSQLSLEQLKHWATSTKDSSIPFISTDDTICAFLWKCISRARLSRLDPTKVSTMSRAVNIRDRVGAPKSYLGMLASFTFQKQSLQVLDNAPLGVIASHLRSLLDPNVVDLVYQVRALGTFIARAGDKRIMSSFTANMNPPWDLMTSSWSKIDCYEYDFNLGLGKPEAVRRPSFPSFECLVYLMPRSPDGDLVVQVCLRDQDWDNLKSDKEFLKYARFIG